MFTRSFGNSSNGIIIIKLTNNSHKLSFKSSKNNGVFPIWRRTFIEFSEFSEFREPDKSLKHKLGSI